MIYIKNLWNDNLHFVLILINIFEYLRRKGFFANYIWTISESIFGNNLKMFVCMVYIKLHIYSGPFWKQ